MFGRLTEWRRLALRDDRCAHFVFSAIGIAAMVIFWLLLTRPDPSAVWNLIANAGAKRKVLSRVYAMRTVHALWDTCADRRDFFKADNCGNSC